MREEKELEGDGGNVQVITLHTAEQAAELLQVSRQRIYELARTGLIPCVRMGRQVRFDEAALKEWVARGGSVEKRHAPFHE